MSDLAKLLLEILGPIIPVITGLVVGIVKLHKRNKQICEVCNVMVGERGIILSKNKDGKYNVDMAPDFRAKLQETYDRARALDLDKKR